MFPTLVSVASALKDGTVRALAVASAHRVASMPELPTVAEAANLPGYEASIWYGVLAPAGTPKEIITRLNAEFRKVLADPELHAQIENQGFSIAPGTPEELGQKIDAELDRWGKLIRRNNIKLD